MKFCFDLDNWYIMGIWVIRAFFTFDGGIMNYYLGSSFNLSSKILSQTTAFLLCFLTVTGSDPIMA